MRVVNIDVEKLKEICEKEESVNITQTDLAKIFNCSKSKIQSTCKKYKIRKRKKSSKKQVCIKNKIYGNLSVIKKVGRRQTNRNSLWLCKCKCGKEIVSDLSTLKAGQSKSCGKCNWIGEISVSIWSSIRRGAKIRKYEFEITQEYVWNLYLEQNKKCSLTGLELKLIPEREKTASLDRINNKLGYIEGNVHWVHKNINMMKNKLSLQDFIDFCHKVSDYNKRD